MDSQRHPRLRAVVITALVAAGLLTATPNTALASPPAGAACRQVAGDDFRHGLRQWITELESGGSVTAADGVLDIDVPGGASVWFRRELTGPYQVDLTVTPVSAGGPNDNVSDLNLFWSARDPRSPDDIFANPRSGAFAEYDLLTTYYVGFGGNRNTTTRFRRYIGVAGERPLLDDRTSPLLVANHPYRLRVVSDGTTVQFWVDGEVLFDYQDPEPYTGGWFAIRTTGSHLQVTDFSVSYGARSTWRPSL